MTFRNTDRWLLVATLGVALFLRIFAALWWEDRIPATQKFGFPDSEGYWELARTIAHGQPYEFGPHRYQVFRTPGYPLLLAPLFLIWQEPPTFAARVLGAFLGTAAVALVGSIAFQIAGLRASQLASAIAAVYPEAIASSVFLLSESPFIPLMLLQIAALLMLSRQATTSLARWSIVAGVAAGLAILMRPSWLLFTPLAIVALTIFPTWRAISLRSSLIVTVAMCGVLAPWWIRNYLAVGQFVPTSLQVGASLYDGISPVANGASDMRYVETFVIAQMADDANSIDQLPGTFESRLDDRMKYEALAWARANPKQVAELAVVKFFRIWSPLPNASEFGSTLLRTVLFVTYAPVMLLAAAGSWMLWRTQRRLQLMLLVLPALYFTLLHTLFVSSIRYRQPAMFLLVVLAAIGLCSMLKLGTHSPALAENTA